MQNRSTHTAQTSDKMNLVQIRSPDYFQNLKGTSSSKDKIFTKIWRVLRWAISFKLHCIQYKIVNNISIKQTSDKIIGLYGNKSLLRARLHLVFLNNEQVTEKYR